MRPRNSTSLFKLVLVQLPLGFFDGKVFVVEAFVFCLRYIVVSHGCLCVFLTSVVQKWSSRYVFSFSISACTNDQNIVCGGFLSFPMKICEEELKPPG